MIESPCTTSSEVGASRAVARGGAASGPDPGAGQPAPPDRAERLRRFRAAYAEHRAEEGRGAGGERELLALPGIRRGPRAAQWRIRARTFRRFLRSVLEPTARAAAPRPLRVLDLGAGNGWLAYRVARRGHRAVALDFRVDRVDGLGAAEAYREHLPALFGRIAASFDAVPLPDGAFDIAVFNASLHYALELEAVLAEAARVVAPGGRLAILDSPFYRSAADGEAMVAEKRRRAAEIFGDRAHDLAGLPFVEYLTPERLREASARLRLEWQRHRVLYPLRYEIRPLLARLRRRRAPSRFDLWEAIVP